MSVVGRGVPLLCLLLLLMALPSAAPPPSFAIRDARIVPMDSPEIDRGTIVFTDGLVAAVGTTVEIPPDAAIIDGRGLTVYPGLIDAMAETGMEASRAAPGATTPSGTEGATQAQPRVAAVQGPQDRPGSTPWEQAADHLSTNDRRIETWRSAGFTTVVATPKGGILPGQSAVVNLAGDRPGDMVVKPAVALTVSLRRSEGFRAYPTSLMGVIAYVRQVFLDTRHDALIDQAYARGTNGRKRPEYDRTVDALQDVVQRKTPVLLPATTRVQILRMLDFGQELGVPTVLYGAHEGYDAAEAIASRKVPVLVSVKWPEKSKDGDPDADEPLRVLRVRDRAPSTPAMLSKAGVRFAFYSDGLATPKEMLQNVRKAIEAGLDEERALRALTLDAATIFGVADRLGSLARGKIANAVVTTGNLFDEKTKVKFVFVDGRKFAPVEPTPAAQPGEKTTVNLTGKWIVTAETPEGAHTSTLDLTMNDDGALSGSASGTHGSGPVTSGSVTGNRFSLTIQLTAPQGQIPVTMSGTVEGNAMKGTFQTRDTTGGFTGTRSGPGGRSDDEGGRS